MKLSIKKEYFDAIKNGSKCFDYRDAHITFVCEETGETLRKEVVDVSLILESFAPEEYRGKGLLEDERIIRFALLN